MVSSQSRSHIIRTMRGLLSIPGTYRFFPHVLPCVPRFAHVLLQGFDPKSNCPSCSPPSPSFPYLHGPTRLEKTFYKGQTPPNLVTISSSSRRANRHPGTKGLSPPRGAEGFQHSPLCSFTCSFRCFLKLKDFPQAGSGQQNDFWWMCWYFLWC